MSFIYLRNGGPNGETARVQGSTYDFRYLAYYRRWPGCYAVFWQPTGTVLTECHSEQGAYELAKMLYRAGKLDTHAPDLAGIEGELSTLIQGWHRIYPGEQPTKARNRLKRAGWQPQPYRVYDADHAGGVWELSGYTRGAVGAVAVRKATGLVVELTHLPSGYGFFLDTESWALATVLADVMTGAIPRGTFGDVPPDAERIPAMQALIAARDAYADQLSAAAA
jgi:hypothetical protein